MVGCANATDVLKEGQAVTVSCAEGDEGRIYDGLIETEVEEVRRGDMPPIDVKIMMNVGNPQLAFDFAQIPNSGVGLARLEFIINNNIGIHPKAVLDYQRGWRAEEGGRIGRGHASPRAFFVEKMAEGVAIAAAFYPKPVIVRMSDFKSNEYRSWSAARATNPRKKTPCSASAARRATSPRTSPSASAWNAKPSRRCAMRWA